MAAVAWYYCAGNSVYYWTKAYDMSATQFAIAVSERIGRTITASDVAQAIRQKEVDAMIPFNPKPATLSACPRHTFFPCITTSLDMSFGMMY